MGLSVHHSRENSRNASVSRSDDSGPRGYGFSCENSMGVTDIDESTDDEEEMYLPKHGQAQRTLPLMRVSTRDFHHNLSSDIVTADTLMDDVVSDMATSHMQQTTMSALPDEMEKTHFQD